MYMTLTVWQNSYVHIYIIDNILHWFFAYKVAAVSKYSTFLYKNNCYLLWSFHVSRGLNAASCFKYRALVAFCISLLNCHYVKKTNSGLYSSSTKRLDYPIEYTKKKVWEAVKSILFKITLDQIKLYTLYSKGERSDEYTQIKMQFFCFPLEV